MAELNNQLMEIAYRIREMREIAGYTREDGIVRKKSRKKKAAEQTNASSGRGAGR